MTDRGRAFAGWATAFLALVFLLVVFSGPSTPRAPHGTISRQSPFLLERYGAPVPREFADMQRIAAALTAAGYPDDASRLTQAWERSTLKGFLGEAHPPPSANVEAAITGEAREAEPIEDLRQRVLERVSLRFSAFADGFSVSRNRTRMSLSNSLAVPVTRVSFVVRLARDDTAAFHCGPDTATAEEAARDNRAEAKLRAAEARWASRGQLPPPEPRERADAWGELQRERESRQGVPIAPGTSASVTCNDTGEAARAILRDQSRAWTPTIVHSAPFIVSSGSARPFGAPDYLADGREAVESADCAALLACDEVARRKRLELKRRSGQVLFVLIAILGPGVAWAVTRRLRREPERPHVTASLVTGLAAAAYGVQFVCVYLLLNPNLGNGVAFLVGGPILLAMLQIVLSGALIAIFTWWPEQVTRFRVALFIGCAFMLPAAAVLMFP